MDLRRPILVAHRWVGLGSAMILVVVGATGAILVWPGTSPIRRLAGAFHDSLALGAIGVWIVLAATAAAVALQCSGVFLWWRNKRLRVNTHLGWRRAMADLHHATGILTLLIMLVISASALGRVAVRVLDTSREHQDLRRIVSRLHTSAEFPVAIKIVYTLGSLSFVVQGLTGVVMWWRRAREE